MKAISSPLHRHEAQLFKLLLCRRVSAWLPAGRALLSALSQGELVRKVGPHHPPEPRHEWEQPRPFQPPRLH